MFTSLTPTVFAEWIASCKNIGPNRRMDVITVDLQRMNCQYSHCLFQSYSVRQQISPNKHRSYPLSLDLKSTPMKMWANRTLQSFMSILHHLSPKEQRNAFQISKTKGRPHEGAVSTMRHHERETIQHVSSAAQETQKVVLTRLI